MGYCLLPARVRWPSTVTIGQAFDLPWTWANRGVAPCYTDAYPTLTLKNNAGGIVSVLSDETLNMRDLRTGPPEDSPTRRHDSSFTVGLIAPTTQAGTVDVFVSVGERDGTPRIALPLANDDGQRRYRLGSLILHSSEP